MLSPRLSDTDLSQLFMSRLWLCLLPMSRIYCCPAVSLAQLRDALVRSCQIAESLCLKSSTAIALEAAAVPYMWSTVAHTCPSLQAVIGMHDSTALRLRTMVLGLLTHISVDDDLGVIDI